ncbi:MAG: alpha-2-macroglobulin [Deltaproteobacteria bacterium]|nr:alpha-2-macroglobulin [Deltaproteobacteria bacterium]
MSRVLILAVAILPLLTGAAAMKPADYPKLKDKAERLFAEKSYQKAHEAYQELKGLELPAAEKRWVAFRLADTLWRSQAGASTPDTSKYDLAQRELQQLVQEAQRVEDRDRVWAEVQESLGDFYWLRPDYRSTSGWSFYQQALDWWAGAPELELARARYLDIVRRAALPPWREAYYYYGYHGTLPLPIVESFLKIAQTEGDKVLGHYLVAMTLQQSGGDYESLARVPQEFEAALKAGKGQDWYDDALWQYGQHLEQQGRLTQTEGGGWRQDPDYPAALALYRRLLSELKKGESRFHDEAKQRIEDITRVELNLSVGGIFLPDSIPQVNLSWRNVKEIDLALYRVDLTRDLRMPKRESDHEEYSEDDPVHRIDLAKAERVKTFTHPTGDQGKHVPGSLLLRWPDKLPAGAYVLEASATGIKGKQRDLILMTDATVTVKAMGTQLVAWFTNALDGAPISGAPALLWQRRYDGNRYVWSSQTGTTDKDGIAAFKLDAKEWSSYVVGVSLKGRQAFSAGSIGQPPGRSSSWRIYAFTDRPAYRPKEKVEFKFVARGYDGSVYSTPKGEQLSWEVTDPRGSKAFEGKAVLDTFGAAWGSLELGETLPLGEYHVTFRNSSSSHLGSATLFRIEEYKLPEFTVRVSTPKEDGKPKIYRLGDKVEAEIQVDYYFGGAVANANVEVLVNQSPYWSHWRPWRAYPWYYEDLYPQPYQGYGGYGSTIKRETLKTDAKGMARIRFDTPRGAGQDFEFRIEARVTDSSRREVVGSDTVRVARQRFSVHATPRHYLFSPKDKVTVDFKALDANDQPVEAQGKVTVTRDWWTEIWLDPNGKEVTGPALEKQRAKAGVAFPPAPGWRLKFHGYHHDEVETRTVKTNAQGELELSFVAEREGYYRVAWLTEEKGRNPITSETSVWVATRATSELGYHQGGLEIIVDQDTFAVGQEVPVMLAAPVPDRWVLFSVEGEDLYHWRVVHLTGTVKLIHVAVEPKHVPNVFLDAAMVSDKQLHRATKQVIVPPVEHFLDVTVKADREAYQPREEATLSIVAKDHAGKPVSAQLAVGMVDESIYYIQQDYAGDPRQFYFGTKRGQNVPTSSLLDWRGFVVPEPEPEATPEGAPGAIGALGSGSTVGDEMDDLSVSEERSGGGGRMRREAEKSAAPARSAMTKDSAALAWKKSPNKSAEAPSSGAALAEQSEGGGGGEVQVRSDFRATALFAPVIVTDAKGQATLKTRLPDSLTTWKTTVRAVGTGSQFGIATATARTRQPLIVRLQAPRFFVVGDVVTVSAVVNNNTSQALQVAPELVAEGVVLEGALVSGKVQNKQPGQKVPANGDARFDWQVRIKDAGPVKLKAVARSGSLADAMELPFVAWPHGIDKTLARGGKLRGDEVRVALDLPERKEGTTRMTVQVAPSQAVTMLDALPYLVDYPYGCTEQTMSRFLPAVVVAKTLKDLGLSPEDAMGRIFGGVEQASAQTTHPKGKKSLEELGKMTEAGLKRLYDFQHSDGGWGWWKDGESDRFMSAYVLWGLSLAARSGVQVREDVVSRAASFLDVNLVNEEVNLDRQAWLLHALSVHQARVNRGTMSAYQQKAFENLWKGRDRLNAYSRALLTLAAASYQKLEQARILIDNLENGVEWDKAEDASVLLKNEPSGKALGTAHWGRERGWWHWSEGAVETTAFVLRALVAVNPQHRLVEPTMNWLVKNRRGAQWSNTRDTAIVVLALNDFLKASGEVAQDVEYALSVNGKEIASRKVAKAQILSAPSVYEVDPKLLKDGKNEIRLVKKSGGALYFFASATFFSLEEPVKAAGNEIFAKRRYFKWVGRPTLLKGHVYERQPLDDGESIQSGERVEVVVTLETKNDYEYLIFEDLKPAGFEAVEVKSGQPLSAQEIRSASVKRAVDDRSLEGGLDYTGRSQSVHQELRDRKVALFVDKLEQGIWEIRYDLRAEVPGQFHALPVMGHAMYVPEIRCNGDEVRVKVVDR